MIKPQKRVRPLTQRQQRQIVTKVIPLRIQLIRDNLCPKYARLATAAIHCKAVAAFLGIKVNKEGRLATDRVHHDHGGGISREVKVVDISGGRYVNIDTIKGRARVNLEDGLKCVSRDFRHLIYLPDDAIASDSDADEYIYTLEARLRRFAHTVVRLYEESATRFQL